MPAASHAQVKKVKRATRRLKNKPSAEIEYAQPQPRRLSALELLPNELLHEILLLSLNIDLEIVSRSLAQALNNEGLRRQLMIIAFGKIRHGWDVINSSLTEDERFKLQDQIMRRKWFSAELFFTCQRDYFGREMPPLLTMFTEDERHAATTMADVEEHVRDRRKKWFITQKCVRLQRARGRYHGTSCVPWPFFNDVGNATSRAVNNQDWSLSNTFEYSSWENSTKTVFDVIYFIPYAAEMNGIQWEFHCEQGAVRRTVNICFSTNLGTIRPWPCRLLNPSIWTEKHLGLLLAFRRRSEGFSTYTLETVKALSNGLMSAIEQKFLPAIFVLAKPFFMFTASQNSLAWGRKWTANLVAEMRDCELEFPYQSWVTEWHHHLQGIPQLRRDHGCRTPESAPTATGDVQTPIAIEHLVHVLDIAARSGPDLGLYFGFCWLCISFAIHTYNRRLGYPSGAVEQLHSLTLQSGKHEDFLMDCCRFFDELLEDLWPCARRNGDRNRRRKRRQHRQYG